MYKPSHIKSIGELNAFPSGKRLSIVLDTSFSGHVNYFIYVSDEQFEATKGEKGLMKELACKELNEKVKRPDFGHETTNIHINQPLSVIQEKR